MKKRIFLITLMVALFVCVFAISSSALTPNNDGEVYVTSDGATLALYDTDGNALAWFKDPTTSEYVPYRVVIDFTATLGSGREIHTNNKTLNDTDGDASTTFPYSLDNLVVFNARNYSAFTYISGTFNGLPLEAIYVNTNFQWINKNTFGSDSALRVFDIPKDHNASNLHIGGSAFAKATNLTYIYIPKNASFESTSSFEYSGLVTVEFASDFANQAKGYEFNGCTALKNVTLANTATKISQAMFKGCTELEHIDIPSGVTVIGQSAFYKCTKLKDVVLPSGLTTIEGSTNNNDDGTFEGCTALKSITIPKSLTSIYGNAFTGSGIETLTFEDRLLPNGTYSPLTFYGWAPFETCKSLKKVVLPEGLTNLQNGMFNYCSSLTSVTFPTSLTNITGGSQFAYTALTEVIGLENTSLPYIANSMFRGVRTWTGDANGVVRLPNTCQYIDGYGLADVQMTTLYLGSSFVGKNTGNTHAFAGTTKLTVVYAPATTQILTQGNANFQCIFLTSSSEAAINTLKSTTGIANTVAYSDYKGNESSYTGKYIITGYNACDAFYAGVHTLNPELSNECAGVCSICAEVKQAANPQHDYVVTITYENYASAGVKIEKCANANCAHNVTPIETSVAAIFESLGYSTDIATKEYIAIGYLINQEALSAYRSANGSKVITYGFVAAAAAADADFTVTKPIGTDGKPIASNIVQVDLANIDNAEAFTAFDFKIVGSFTNEDNQAVKLGMCLYVAESSVEVVEGEVITTSDVKYVVAANNTNGITADSIGFVTYAQMFI